MPESPLHHRLGHSQGYAQVEDLLVTLREVLQAKPSEVHLDGSEVEQVDTSTLQLLAAFSRDLKAQGGSLTWEAPSTRLRQIAHIMGMSEALGLPRQES